VATFAELFERLDPDDNVTGKQFERICKWYLEHDETYASQLTRVWLWKDWPDRWHAKMEAPAAPLKVKVVAPYRVVHAGVGYTDGDVLEVPDDAEHKIWLQSG
jgi:hypothetical protein